MSDPYLERAHSSVPMDIWLMMEAQLCDCEDLCICEWDDVEEEEE